MKKAFSLVLGLSLISCVSFAQIKKDSLVKMMSKDVCNEINKKDITGKTIDDFEIEIGMAMIPVFTKYKKEIEEVWGVETLDSESGELIGREIGIQLAADCPSFLQLILNSPDALKSAADKKKPKELKVTGTLQKINNADISYVETKDATGKVEKLYWLEYFEGANNLMNEPNKFINKKITFTYSEKEVYKSSLKDYSKIKVITGMRTE
ncbi:MAG: hypothetical protein ACOVO1_02255 [Chitinophagaceae bacterium]